MGADMGPLWEKSDDIVRELRRYADGCVYDYEPHVNHLLRDAATVIEQLRARHNDLGL